MAKKSLSDYEMEIEKIAQFDRALIAVTSSSGAWSKNPEVTVLTNGNRHVFIFEDGISPFEFRKELVERLVRCGQVVQNNVKEPIEGWTHRLMSSDGRCFYMAGDDHDATLAAIKHGLFVQ